MSRSPSTPGSCLHESEEEVIEGLQGFVSAVCAENRDHKGLESKVFHGSLALEKRLHGRPKTDAPSISRRLPQTPSGRSPVRQPIPQ
ncbi:hypothetical protein Q8A67_021903 [Cirrhinus molitorella]|uniref:Uncharacterized protein n=1 Tax=Cirrhinus molitorella TaxID=172907 RepID=A0AA88TDJ3_9TELE|nr:hypothetical protein Q8A67_021903 [Cirrhinus molitorella]